ncbi:MAG: universal stress protein, partial [Burkholderiaceae bacterium]|nr:universal stress protein [Burkholderiaceae bacterium]
GSHGCAGWDHVLTGSVSNKVLATAHVPVLVYRLKEDEVPEGVSHSYELAFPM